MFDPFASALVALFRAPGSEAAVYTAPGGPPTPLRVIRERGEREVRKGISRVMVDGNAVQIQRTDVAQPVNGALLTIGAEAFLVQGGAALDSEGLTWTCHLTPA